MKHPLRMMTHVEPVLELSQICWQVLSGYVNMSTVNTAFQLRPEAFQPVHMDFTTGVFLRPVFNSCMAIAKAGQDFVRCPFVSADFRSLGNIVDDRRNQVLASGTRYNLGINLSPTLKDTHNNGLALGTTASEALNLGALATNVSLVNFDVVSHGRDTVHFTHVLTNLMAHPPSTLVGDAYLPLQFLGSYAMSGCGEQVHGIEPLNQWSSRRFKWRTSHRANLMAAPLALIHRALPVLGKLACLLALRASQRVAVACLHQMLKARIVIREKLEKLKDCHLVAHNGITIANHATGVKGINASQHYRTPKLATFIYSPGRDCCNVQSRGHSFPGCA